MTSRLKSVSVKEMSPKSVLKKIDREVDALNAFLSRYAVKNDELGIGKTFVALDEKNQILGYFTLTMAQVACQEIPDDFRGKLPKYPVPALRIARLAVNKDLKRKGIGKWLLAQAFIKAIHVADVTGLYFIIVDLQKAFIKIMVFISFLMKIYLILSWLILLKRQCKNNEYISKAFYSNR